MQEIFGEEIYFCKLEPRIPIQRVWFDKLCEEYINYAIIEKNGNESVEMYDEVMEKDRFTINAMAHGINNIYEAVDYCRRWQIHV